MLKIKKKIRKIIINTLRLKKNIKISLNSDKIESWDSIGHLQIVLSLEKEFKVKFYSKEISQMLSEKKIYNIIKNKKIILSSRIEDSF
jgi:acyl carrier protein